MGANDYGVGAGYEKRKLIRQWVDALASGKYNKGKGFLKAHDGEREVYCCLGVACDLFGEHEWVEDDGGRQGMSLIYSYNGQTIFLDHHKKTAIKLGLDYLHIRALARANDEGPSKDKDYSDVIKYLNDEFLSYGD